MPDEEQISQLAQLGLNAYEARAYLALLGKESFSASQVADLSGVPRQRIYDILASLVEQGLAVSRPGRRGTKYAAVAPSVALQALLGRAKQQVTALETTTNSLISTLASQYAAGKGETSPLEYIEVLRGRAAINQRFAEIQANCRREILVFTKPPYATPPQENVEGLETLHRRVRRSHRDTRKLDPPVGGFQPVGERRRHRLDHLDDVQARRKRRVKRRGHSGRLTVLRQRDLQVLRL